MGLQIGDAINDYEAAKDSKIPFIGRVDEIANNIFSDYNLKYVVNDLTQLEEIIINLFISG